MHHQAVRWGLIHTGPVTVMSVARVIGCWVTSTHNSCHNSCVTIGTSALISNLVKTLFQKRRIDGSITLGPRQGSFSLLAHYYHSTSCVDVTRS